MHTPHACITCAHTCTCTVAAGAHTRARACVRSHDTRTRACECTHTYTFAHQSGGRRARRERQRKGYNRQTTRGCAEGPRRAGRGAREEGSGGGGRQGRPPRPHSPVRHPPSGGGTRTPTPPPTPPCWPLRDATLPEPPRLWPRRTWPPRPRAGGRRGGGLLPGLQVLDAGQHVQVAGRVLLDHVHHVVWPQALFELPLGHQEAHHAGVGAAVSPGHPQHLQEQAPADATIIRAGLPPSVYTGHSRAPGCR